jgi:hypothetical protein
MWYFEAERYVPGSTLAKAEVAIRVWSILYFAGHVAVVTVTPFWRC